MTFTSIAVMSIASLKVYGNTQWCIILNKLNWVWVGEWHPQPELYALHQTQRAWSMQDYGSSSDGANHQATTLKGLYFHVMTKQTNNKKKTINDNNNTKVRAWVWKQSSWIVQYYPQNKSRLRKAYNVGLASHKCSCTVSISEQT